MALRSKPSSTLDLGKGTMALANAEYKVCCCSAWALKESLWRVSIKRVSDFCTLSDSNGGMLCVAFPLSMSSAPSCSIRGESWLSQSNNICTATIPSTSLIPSQIPLSTSALCFANVAFSSPERSRRRISPLLVTLQHVLIRSQVTTRIFGKCLKASTSGPCKYLRCLDNTVPRDGEVLSYTIRMLWVYSSKVLMKLACLVVWMDKGRCIRTVVIASWAVSRFV